MTRTRTAALPFAILMAALVAVMVARRYLNTSRNPVERAGESPGSDNPAAFMTASMQAVIKKLKEQEKELEASFVSFQLPRTKP